MPFLGAIILGEDVKDRISYETRDMARLNFTGYKISEYNW
jgi:hypothetical protein